MGIEESMIIGIVTQPLCANYGGILQNYALQQVLKRLGHTPVTLDYLPSLSFGRYLLYAGKTALCTFSPKKRHPLKPYSHFIIRPPAIKPFIDQNITLTKTFADYSRRILKKYHIDALLVGSDQIWRYSYNSHYLEDMYLAFAKDYPCPKIAYGSSFGVEDWDYPDHRTAEVQELVKQFKSISVRENSGVSLCKRYLGVHAATVLDPTMLLTDIDYVKFCTAPPSGEQPYLAAYVLDMNDEKASYIKAVAEYNHLAVREMTISREEVSVEQWLTTIRNAAFVITDSYHGCLFSILFKKQFQAIINKERGADRFITVLDALGLRDRLLYDTKVEPAIIGPIDYKDIAIKLDILRNSSIQYLHDSLN